MVPCLPLDRLELRDFCVLVGQRRDEREIAFPLWPTLPWHVWRERPDVILMEGGSNLPSAFLLVATAALLRGFLA